MGIFHKNTEYFSQNSDTVQKVKEELDNGLALLNTIEKPLVTFFGSHLTGEDTEIYQQAKHVARAFGERGYAIMSGGGPGIMHATNAGATQAGAPSLGLQAKLLTDEKVLDPIFTHTLAFHFLFVRRFIMSIKSEALIFYPGGYGTLNELFEYLVLMQTGIVDTVPIICIDKTFWCGLFTWLEEHPFKKQYLIHQDHDLKLIRFANSFEEIMSIIKEATPTVDEAN